MEVAVYNIKGEDTGRKVTLNDEVFGRDLTEGNAEHTLYLDVKQYLGNQRQGTHKSKERSEVSGSTRKLIRRKGAGGRTSSARLPHQTQQEAESSCTPRGTDLEGSGNQGCGEFHIRSTPHKELHGAGKEFQGSRSEGAARNA